MMDKANQLVSQNMKIGVFILKKNVSLILVVLSLTVIALFQYGQKSESQQSTIRSYPQIGQPAPQFQLEGLDGESYSFAGERDKPLFVHFWTSWCDSCKAEFPSLIQLYSQFKEKIDFYTINVTGIDHVEQVRAFVQQYQLPFPILLDPLMQVSNAYQVTAVPTSFIIHRSGVMAKQFYHLSFEQLEKEFQNISLENK